MNETYAGICPYHREKEPWLVFWFVPKGGVMPRRVWASAVFEAHLREIGFFDPPFDGEEF